MGQHLVVDEFIALGALHDAVQRQHAAEAAGLEDADLLVFRLALEEDFLDFVTLAEPGIQRFVKPGGHRISPRFISVHWMLSGRKARRSTGMALAGWPSPQTTAARAASTFSGQVWVCVRLSARTAPPELPRLRSRAGGERG